MTDLLTRLENAKEGSRELDALIAVAIRSMDTEGDKTLPEWADKNFPTWRARLDGRVECVHTDGAGGLNWRPRRYTTSLDAALPWEDIHRVERVQSVNETWWKAYQGMHVANGATEALARRIAALRARAA